MTYEYETYISHYTNDEEIEIEIKVNFIVDTYIENSSDEIDPYHAVDTITWDKSLYDDTKNSYIENYVDKNRDELFCKIEKKIIDDYTDDEVYF